MAAVCAGEPSEITFDLTPDNYGSPRRHGPWWTDADGTTVLSGGPYTNNQQHAHFSVHDTWTKDVTP